MWWALGVAGASLVGVTLGLWIGRRALVPLRLALVEDERVLWTEVVPAIEAYARSLGIAFVQPVHDPSTGRGLGTAVAHLAALSKSISQKERENSVALSDTVQIAKAELIQAAGKA